MVSVIMNFETHIKLKAKYSRRMNVQVYESALQLSDDDLVADMGAFFGSINGVLNHILVGDLLWFSRFSKLSARYGSLVKILDLRQPTSLSEILFNDTAELWVCRQRVDALIEAWSLTELEDQDGEQPLRYANAKGEVSTRRFSELVSHAFNHQTHHRGQVSTLLYQKGIDIGVTDYLMDVPVID